jgi:transcriptional regulator with XRE-family HTH domain
LDTEHRDIQDRREAFERRVRELRKAKGIKSETLATALSYIARTSISHIERGGEDVPLTKILAYAREREVLPRELFVDRLPTVEAGNSLAGRRRD